MDGSGHFLYSKEGVTKGDPLAMISYGIGIPLLVLEICATHPQLTHMRYMYDDGVGVIFMSLQAHMRDLMVRGI